MKKGETIKNRISTLREELGLTQAQLAKKVFLCQRNVSRAESGNCSLATIITFADFFGVSIDYILNRTDERNNSDDGWDSLDILIIDKLKSFSSLEKEKFIEHLKVEQSFRRKSGG